MIGVYRILLKALFPYTMYPHSMYSVPRRLYNTTWLRFTEWKLTQNC